MSETVGVIGLGAMGSGMARSLRRAGYDVQVFDVRPARPHAFAEDGGTACTSTRPNWPRAARWWCRWWSTRRRPRNVLFGGGRVAAAR